MCDDVMSTLSLLLLSLSLSHQAIYSEIVKLSVVVQIYKPNNFFAAWDTWLFSKAHLSCDNNNSSLSFQVQYIHM